MKNLIIDGNNLIHRTFWTAKTQSLRSNIEDQDKINDFHIYFTLNAIFSYAKMFASTHTYIGWDEKKGDKDNPRKQIYYEYKGNRSNDTSPHQNNKKIQYFLELLGIKSVFPLNLEADDIIGYLSTLHGYNTIVSVDKDFLQLVDPHVNLYDPIRKKEYNHINFTELTGCSDSKRWLYEKCLLGDKSDNVPGAITRTKLKKIDEGKYSLTDDEKSIYERNINLFSLKNIDILSKIDDINFYREQVLVEPNANWQTFLDECSKHGFNSILNKKSEWYNCFFMRKKLRSLFS